MNLTQLNKELQIGQAVQLYKVSLTGLTLRIDVILKNPTPGSIRVKTPYITVSYNGEVIASSDTISATDHVVPRYGEVALDPIYITMGYLQLALNARSFWEQYRSTGKAALSIRALTRINDVFPVEKTTTFNLGAAPPTQLSTGKPGAGLAGLLTDALVLSEQPVSFVPQRRSHRRLSS